MINRTRSLRRDQIVRRSRVDRVVVGIARARKTGAREWFNGWKYEKLIADGRRAEGTDAECEVRVRWSWPEAILDVESRAVGRLSKTKQLEICRSVARDRFLRSVAFPVTTLTDTLCRTTSLPPSRYTDRISRRNAGSVGCTFGSHRRFAN